jgi:hypothetical protein
VTRPPAVVAAADAAAPRPVTTGRRVLGMALDLVGVTLAFVVLVVAAQAVEYLRSADRVLDAHPLRDAVLGTWLPTVVLLLVVPLLGNGATPGQRAVRLRPAGDPVFGRALVRFLVGSGGYLLLSGLDMANSWNGVLSLWLLVHLIGAWRTRGHRGLSGVVAGLEVVDSRSVTPSPVAAR